MQLFAYVNELYMHERKMRTQSVWLFYGIAVVAVILDQLTKWLANTNLVYGQPQNVLPILDWLLAYNRGAAFSFLSDQGGWQRWLFTSISLVVSIVLIVWLKRLQANEKLLSWALALVLGGAVGNLIDRAFYGYVVDFIAVHYEQHYFPTFNIADSAISIGAGLLLLEMFLNPNKKDVTDSEAG